jgi:hypothetical protein
MADLFDGIPAGENLQGDTSEWEGVDKKQDSTTPFKDKVADLHATIEAEPIEPEPDNEEAVMPKKSSVQSKSEPKGKQEKPPVSDSKEQENQVLTHLSRLRKSLQEMVIRRTKNQRFRLKKRVSRSLW